MLSYSVLTAGLTLALGCGGRESDAASPVIQGSSIVTYHPLSGESVNRPEDLSDQINFPSGSILAHLPNGTGGYTTYAGSGMADGTFRINAAPTGHYWLRVGSTYLWTDQTNIDLGYDQTGRPDSRRPTEPTNVIFNVSNLSPWNDSSHRFYYYECNTGTSWAGFSASDPANNPSNGDTTLSEMAVNWLQADAPLNDGSKGDHPYLVQLSILSTTIGSCRIPQKVFEPTPYTQTNGRNVTLTGAFTEISQTETLRLNVKASEFALDLATIGPNAVPSDQLFSFGAMKGAATYGSFGTAGELTYFAFSTPQVADFDLGEIPIKNPFPSTWDTFLYSYTSYKISHSLPGTTTPRDFSAFLGVETSSLPSATDPLRPLVTPVRNPRIEGVDLLTNQSGVGLTPKLSWQAPAVGSPSVYVVDIYWIFSSGLHTRAYLGPRLFTNSTSMQLPPDVLRTGLTYVFRVSAIQCGNTRVSSPLRNSMPNGRADVISGIIAP